MVKIVFLGAMELILLISRIFERPIVIQNAGVIQKGRGESDLVKDIEKIVGPDGLANLIDATTSDTNSTVSISVDLSTGQITGNQIIFL